MIAPPTDHELREPVVRDATAYPKSAVLPGVTRGAVLELAESMQIRTRLASININDLLEADEVFLTNSIMQVMPVCRIERRAVGDEKPGAITVRLSEALQLAREREADQ